jgi:proteasome lid subunit RPN8/RPN11
MIRLSRELLSAMAGEARARYPEECVGALVGRPAPEGDGVREVVRVAVAGNERATRRERRYWGSSTPTPTIRPSPRSSIGSTRGPGIPT